MDRSKILEYCLEEARKGKEFSILREELTQLELEPDDINQIIKYVNNQMLNQAFSSARKSHR